MNLDHVTELLREHVAAGLECVAAVRGPIGNGQETWFVTTRGGEPRELVLRRTAAAGTLEWTERAHEHAVLCALAGRGIPVPTVYGLAELERPVLLMERCPGAPVGRLDAEGREALGRELGAWLARLHRLDPRALGLPLPRSSREATLAEVERWHRLYHDARAEPVPLLAGLLAWAESNVPDDGIRPVVLWGDPGPHNVLLADGRVTALLDWELSHVGHPLDDLGAAIWSCLGRIEPGDVVAGYEEEAGATVDRSVLDYFVALACATRSVMVVNGVKAWLDGRVAAPSAAALGLDLLAVNLARGTEAAGWGTLPAPDGAPPRWPFRPDAAETAAGVARWLVAEALPALEDRRQQRLFKSAAALLEAAARRIGPEPAADAAAVEEEVVRAERRGGDPELRTALLADLAREWARLEPLTRMHRHPLPPGVS